MLESRNPQQDPRTAESGTSSELKDDAATVVARSRRAIAEAVFPNWRDLPSLEELERRFPLRDLPQDAMVTRVGPSPTGMMHLGGLYTAMINRTLAHQTGGKFFLRIEDTDAKRTVVGALDTIVDSLADYDLGCDEGPVRGPAGVSELGAYGPYIQTGRKEIYHAVAFDLLCKGVVYPCFMTPAELDAIRAEQQSMKARPGIYGPWAHSRNLDAATVLQTLSDGAPFVLRLRSLGSADETVTIEDRIRGALTLPRNDMDAVLIKSDGIPTYHFAHLVDDHFMRTTDVIRAEEWIPSLPLHVELFERMGWEPPRYGHIAAIYKQEGDSRRKLSKRKDPEADVRFYWEQGFTKEAVVEYLLNLANSNFEGWRKENPGLPASKFELSLDRFGSVGPLADLVKLQSISREILSSLPIEEVYHAALKWSSKFEPQLAEAMHHDPELAKRALDIERSGEKAAKRLVTLADVRTQLKPFYSEFLPNVSEMPFPASVPVTERAEILRKIAERFDGSVSATETFAFLKGLAVESGYAASAKDFRSNPDSYKGQLGDFVMTVRVAMFGSTRTPDLGQVMQVLGPAEVARRCERVIAHT